MKKVYCLLSVAFFMLCSCADRPAEDITPPVQTEAAAAPASEVPADSFLDRISRMSLEEKAAQMFIARCPADNAAELAAQYQLGGYILFARDFKDSTPDKLRQTIQSYQKQANIPMLIGVDEEGGTVNRVSRYPQFRRMPFQSPQDVFAAGGMNAVYADAKEKAAFLSGLGINLNFAPVCDVSQNPADFIYARAFGKDAEMTAEYVDNVVRGMREMHMGSVLKHFPGYGNNADTHTGVAYDERKYNQFEESDFLPFQAGIDAGADMVLVSHNIVACMDAKYPASLSPNVHRILREELGFGGVIITDDLVMDAIGQYTDDESAAVLAVQAGNDMLCCTNFTEQIPAVVRAVREGKLEESRLEESVLKILKLKKALGLLQN